MLDAELSMTEAVKQRVGPCVFCQREGRFTQEHVIPRWVRKVLKTGPVEITDRQTGDRFRYDQTLTLVVNDAVCQDCNTGWLRELGESVRPDVTSAILGSPVALTSARARTLATWATERALLSELALREARVAKYAPASCLRWVYAHRDDPTPPPGTQIWMAYLDATTAFPAWSITGTWPEGLQQPEGYISTFSLGCVVFLAFGQDFRESDHHAPDGRALGCLELPGRFGGYVVPIWPYTDELIVWPPTFGLSRQDLTEVARLLSVAKVRRPEPAGLHRIDG
jgi:hypothetical protein